MRFPLSLTFSMAAYIIRKKLTRTKRFPLVLMLEPLHACNLTCTGCGRIREYSSTIKEKLSVEECLGAVDECGAPIVSICGGEPMIYPELGQLVRGILRRRKQDVAAELPPKTEVIRRVQLHGQQRALYESVRLAADEQVRRVLERKSFAGAQIAILDALLKLRQVCCDPRLVKGAATPATMEGAKMALLTDMLPELVAEGRRVLVFSQFTEMLALLRANCRKAARPAA